MKPLTVWTNVKRRKEKSFHNMYFIIIPFKKFGVMKLLVFQKCSAMDTNRTTSQLVDTRNNEKEWNLIIDVRLRLNITFTQPIQNLFKTL